MKTGCVPKLILYDKYLILSALLFTCSSFCTFEIWNLYDMNPYMYSMGTSPSLFMADVLQNGRHFHILSPLTLLSWIFVNVDTLHWFGVKCILSSLASYMSSIGLEFNRPSGFEERSSKVVSFSLISAIIPLFWVVPQELPENQLLEYAHALLGGVNGLFTAFLLSYSGALAKVSLSSVKDVLFLGLQYQYLTSLSYVSMFCQCVVSSAVSMRRATPSEPTTPSEPNKSLKIELEQKV